MIETSRDASSVAESTVLLRSVFEGLVVLDHLHGKASAGESPALAHTCDSCGQQIFLLKAKLVQIGQEECVNELHLVF